MRLRIFTLLLLMTASCGTENITEVGNPTPPTEVATTSAATSALSTNVVGLVNPDKLSSLTQALTNRSLLASRESERFSCSFGENALTFTCHCPGGGTTTQTLQKSSTGAGNTQSFNTTLTLTFNNCVETSCKETTTLNGQITGTLTGTFDQSTKIADLKITQETSAACSGITINDVPIGFNMTMTYDGSRQDFSGNFCIDGKTLSFSNLKELKGLVDPGNSCPSSFESL